MANPADADVLLPDDSSNTGKKIRTQTRTLTSLGVSTHEHFFVPTLQQTVEGVYRALVNRPVQASADNGTTLGLAWLWNPVGATRALRLRQAYIVSGNASATLTTSQPWIYAARFTATGTASGSTQAPSLRDSSRDAAATGLLLITTPTGLTVTLGNPFGAAAVMEEVTASGMIQPTPSPIFGGLGETEEDWVVIRAGEGIVFYQQAAGTSGDGRLLKLIVGWDEVDTPSSNYNK